MRALVRLRIITGVAAARAAWAATISAVSPRPHRSTAAPSSRLGARAGTFTAQKNTFAEWREPRGGRFRHRHRRVREQPADGQPGVRCGPLRQCPAPRRRRHERRRRGGFADALTGGTTTRPNVVKAVLRSTEGLGVLIDKLFLGFSG